VVPGSIPGETLLLLVREVFLDVVRKREEFGGGFGNFETFLVMGVDEAFDSSAKRYIVEHRGGRECDVKSMIVVKHGRDTYVKLFVSSFGPYMSRRARLCPPVKICHISIY
jgi:hypothetical protein